MRVVPQLLISCQIHEHILCQVGVASFKKSWEVESQGEDDQWKSVESGFLPCCPARVANAQESFKRDSNGGVDGASEANVEKWIGDLVDHSIHIGARMTSKGATAQSRTITDNKQEVVVDESSEEFEKGLLSQMAAY